MSEIWDVVQEVQRLLAGVDMQQFPPELQAHIGEGRKGLLLGLLAGLGMTDISGVLLVALEPEGMGFTVLTNPHACEDEAEAQAVGQLMHDISGHIPGIVAEMRAGLREQTPPKAKVQGMFEL